MTYQVHHGDCLEVMRSFAGSSIDLTVTSPPYDNLRTYKGNSCFDFEGIAKELYRVTKDGGVVVWIVSDATINGSETGTSFKQAIYFKDAVGFNLHDTMIYKQAGTGAKGSCYAYWQSFEFMFVFAKGRPKTVNRIADVKNKTIGLVRQGRFRDGGNQEPNHKTNTIGIRSNVWDYAVGFMDSSDKTSHPAPFPVSLAQDHVISWSSENDTVLDCFAGSGTTGVACINTNRNAILIERELEYIEIIHKRLKKAASQPSLIQYAEIKKQPAHNQKALI